MKKDKIGENVKYASSMFVQLNARSKERNMALNHSIAKSLTQGNRIFVAGLKKPDELLDFLKKSGIQCDYKQSSFNNGYYFELKKMKKTDEIIKDLETEYLKFTGTENLEERMPVTDIDEICGLIYNLFKSEKYKGILSGKDINQILKTLIKRVKND